MDPIPTPAPGRVRLEGFLRLTCAVDAQGRSRLSRKAFRSPIHISKPHWDGGALLLNLMTPTAGMLGDDSVDVDVVVENSAALVLSNPSALRVHKMAVGQRASWRQRFTVHEDGFLESNPEWLILQAESDFEQETCIDVAPGAELLFIETIAPGRIAHGEAFRFRSFRSRQSLRFDGRLALLEKHSLEPNRNTHLGWTCRDMPTPFYASILMVSEKLERDGAALWSSIHAMQSENLRIGSSRLAHGPCWNVRLLAADASLARKTIGEVRQQFYRTCHRPCPPLRRQ